MPSSSYDYIVFDAANTLIYKPDLWVKINVVLQKHGYSINQKTLIKRHKLLSEIINFPDRTSQDFYDNFNAELLLSLGIVPTPALLSDLFSACSYLPWEVFDDTSILQQLNYPLAILSNFNSSLTTKIESLFGKSIFQKIITSEVEGSRKPEIEFYQNAVDQLNTAPERILYIGDSLKLDIIPAKKIGIQAFLIDRDNIFTAYPQRLSTLAELKDSIK